jgi:hypothetical protein
MFYLQIPQKRKKPIHDRATWGNTRVRLSGSKRRGDKRSGAFTEVISGMGHGRECELIKIHAVSVISVGSRAWESSLFVQLHFHLLVYLHGKLPTDQCHDCLQFPHNPRNWPNTVKQEERQNS